MPSRVSVAGVSVDFPAMSRQGCGVYGLAYIGSGFLRISSLGLFRVNSGGLHAYIPPDKEAFSGLNIIVNLPKGITQRSHEDGRSCAGTRTKELAVRVWDVRFLKIRGTFWESP